MALGTPTYDYFMNPMVTFETEEGDYTVIEAEGPGGLETVGTFPAASVINKGTFIESVAPGTDGFLRVGRAAGGVQNLLGIAFVKADWRKDEDPPEVVGTYDDSPGFPKPHREVTVELFGSFMREVPVGTSGTNVTLGGSIAPHSSEVDVWEGDGTPNDTYATQAATLGTDTTCVAVFNFGGRF